MRIPSRTHIALALAWLALPAAALAAPATYPAEMTLRPLVLPRGMLEGSLSFWSRSADRLYDANGRRQFLGFAPGDTVSEEGTALNLRYGLLENVDASLTVPFVARRIATSLPLGPVVDNTTGQQISVYVPSSYNGQGIGDLSLAVDYQGLEVPDPQFWAAFGVAAKLANASANASLSSFDDGGIRGKAPLGSGQTDVTPRVRAKLLVDPVDLTASVGYRIRMKHTQSITIPTSTGGVTTDTEIDPGNVLELHAAAEVEALPSLFPSLGIAYAQFSSGRLSLAGGGASGNYVDFPSGSATSASLQVTAASARVDASVEILYPLAGKNFPVAGYEPLVAGVNSVGWPDRTLDGGFGGTSLQGTVTVRF